MTNAQIMNKVNKLEQQIGMIKWLIISQPTFQRHSDYKGIVKSTSGILSKKFPSGITYENRIRKTWNKHFIRSK